MNDRAFRAFAVQHMVIAGALALDELPQQAGLSNAGFPRDKQQPALSVATFIELQLELIPLLLSSDERLAMHLDGPLARLFLLARGNFGAGMEGVATGLLAGIQGAVGNFHQFGNAGAVLRINGIADAD